MAPHHALAALLSLVGTAGAQIYTSDYYDDYTSDYYSKTSAFWTVTQRYAAIVTPSVYTRGSGAVTTYTYTDRMRTVKPSVTPTATPTSVSTYDSNYAGVQYVYQYYGLNAVAVTDVEPEYDDENYSSTTRSSISTSVRFSMPVTMTAPASCPTQFTVTTTASVTVPSVVRSQITPSSKATGSTSTYGSSYTYVYETWYLSAGSAPFTSTDDYYYSYYIASCSTPPSARTTSNNYYGGGSSSSGGDDDNDSSSSYCYSYSYYCGSSLRIWIIVVATVIPGLFLLGFLESWFWFRRLMMGKSAMRFGTVCWVLISLWVMCFTRMQDSRSKEDQKLLQEKWKTMGSGAAFKAWWKWGFRHAYPVEHLGQFSKTTVGVVPAGQPLHPAMSQTPPGFMPGPPPPGAPGQVYYYGPPPPGWIPTPDGQGFMPPQGYMYPPPQQAGYYGGDLSKNGSTVSSSPASLHPAMAQQPQGQAVSPIGTSPAQPQAPQPAYHANSAAPMAPPSPPPQGPVPDTPTAPTAPAVPTEQPPSHVSEAPANPTPSSTSAPQLPPLKNDSNDRSLYE